MKRTIALSPKEVRASYQKPTLTYHAPHSHLIQQISIPLTPINTNPKFFCLDLEGDNECQF